MLFQLPTLVGNFFGWGIVVMCLTWSIISWYCRKVIIVQCMYVSKGDTRSVLYFYTSFPTHLTFWGFSIPFCTSMLFVSRMLILKEITQILDPMVWFHGLPKNSDPKSNFSDLGSIGYTYIQSPYLIELILFCVPTATWIRVRKFHATPCLWGLCSNWGIFLNYKESLL